MIVGRMMKKNFRFWLFAIVPGLCLLSLLVYFLPPVHDRLAWRVDEVVLRIKYQLNPPAEEVFVPQEIGTALPEATPTPIPAASATLPPTPTASTATPEPSPTPDPGHHPSASAGDAQWGDL